MMDNIEEIKQVLYGYETAGLIEGDIEKVLSFLSDNIIGIGIGEQGFVSSKEDIAKIMRDTIKKDTKASYALDYKDIEIRFTDENVANICAEIIVLCTENGKVTLSAFMQSLNLHLENGKWLIVCFHASPLVISDESINAYPLDFAYNTINKLRSEITTEAFDLMSTNFVGGVVGVHHVGDKYPLYFANDGIAKFLGYSVDEFHEVFDEDVAKIFYAGDIDYVMKLTDDVLLRNIDCAERLRLQKKDGGLLPVIDYARKSQDSEGNDILIAVFTDISELVALQEQLEQQNATILSSIRYASKIQKNLLPTLSQFKGVFSDFSALWKPRDIVGGDIYWIKKFSEGVIMCVCDCTGHGTPGALLTMLVCSTFDNIVNENNYKNVAQLMLKLDQRIATVLNVHTAKKAEDETITHIHDGCDAAIIFVANDGTVKFSSSGIRIFVCNGSDVKQFKGQRLHIGDGLLMNKEDVAVTEIAADLRNKFYIASDGLFDQIGGEQLQPFGYRVFKEIILQNHTKGQDLISKKVWEAFESYRGDNHRRDDVELITFKP